VKEFWSSFLLPFVGLIVSMNLLTTFTHWSSMDALLVILVNLLTDLTYALLDPRVSFRA